MKIIGIYIKNFKSIEDAELNELGEVNIIVGKNNSGKSAFFELLTERWHENLLYIKETDKRHASEEYASLELEVEFDEEELEPFYKKIIDKKDEIIEMKKTDYFKKLKAYYIHKGSQRTGKRIMELIKIEMFNPEKKSYVDLWLESGGQSNVGNQIIIKPLGYPDLRTPLEMLNKYTAKTNCPILYLQNFQDKISRLTEFRKLISEQALNPTRSLNSEGDNLVNYLHFLKTNDEEKFLEIQNALKEVYTFGSLCSPVDPNTKIVRVGLIKNKKEVTLDNLGSGIFEILIVLTYILSRKKGDIVILEEPENHLHPSAIEKLKNIIDRKKDMVQFFIISHSPYMLNHYNLEDLRSIRRFYLDEKETTKTAMVPKDFFTYVASDDEIRTNEEVYETMTKLNRDLLMSIFLDDVYLVEGAGDVIYFSKLINMISKETNYVIDVGGDGSLLSVSKFLSYLKIKHKVIADENEDRKEHHKEIENSGVPIHILDKKLEHYLIDKTDHIKPPKTFEQVRKLEEIGLEKARTQIGEKRYDALLTFLTETTPAFGRHNQQK